jgi:hypothetical protein
MWIRAVPLMLAIGCVGVGAASEDPATTVMESTTVGFHCLNHTSIHVVVCEGSISLFPITINVDYLYVLSDNELTILSGDLNDLTIVDEDTLDDNKVLGDVEATVADDFLDKFHITVTNNDIVVCTTVTGSQICR